MKHQRCLRSMNEWKMCCGNAVWCRKQAKYNQTKARRETHMLLIIMSQFDIFTSTVWRAEIFSANTCKGPFYHLFQMQVLKVWLIKKTFSNLPL